MVEDIGSFRDKKDKVKTTPFDTPAEKQEQSDKESLAISSSILLGSRPMPHQPLLVKAPGATANPNLLTAINSITSRKRGLADPPIKVPRRRRQSQQSVRHDINRCLRCVSRILIRPSIECTSFNRGLRELGGGWLGMPHVDGSWSWDSR